jgi:hypothetical protein
VSEGEPFDRGAAAALGLAFHAAREVVAAGAVPDLKAIAREHGVPEAPLRALFAGFQFDARKRWPGAIVTSEQKVELTVGDHHFRGRYDESALYYEGDDVVLRMIDYKTGSAVYGDEASEQMQATGYALARLRELRAEGYEVARVVVSLCYVERGDSGWSNAVYTPDELERQAERLARIADRAASQASRAPAKREYGRGSWCSFCRGRARCPVLLRDVAVVMRREAKSITREDCAAVFAAAEALRKIAEEAKSMVAAVLEDVGAIDAAREGYELAMTSRWMPRPLSEDLLAWAWREAFIYEGMPAEARAAADTGLATFLAALRRRPQYEQRFPAERKKKG